MARKIPTQLPNRNLSILEKIKSFIGGTSTGFSPSTPKPATQPMLPEGYFPWLQQRGSMPVQQQKPPDLSRVADLIGKQVMSGMQKSMALSMLGKIKTEPTEGFQKTGIPGMSGAIGTQASVSKLSTGQAASLAAAGDPDAIQRIVKEISDRVKEDLKDMKDRMKKFTDEGKRGISDFGSMAASLAAPGLREAAGEGYGAVRTGFGIARGGIALGRGVSGLMGGGGAFGGAGAAGVAGGAVAGAGVATGAVAGIGLASVALVKWAGLLSQSSMALSKFSVGMSSVAMEHNLRQMRLERREGEALAGSTRNLSRALDAFQEDLQPIKIGIKEQFQGFLTDFVNGLRVIKNQTFELSKLDQERKRKETGGESDLDKVMKNLQVEKWHQRYGRPQRFNTSGTDFNGGDF